jgi:hypothetical protein
MVERTEAQGFEEFVGTVETVEIVESGIKEGGKQIKLSIKTDPEDLTKSGYMYNWVGIPRTATENSVPQGSVIDAYIRALERLNAEMKKAKSVNAVFEWMQGKKFLFSKEKLGKAYGGHEAADYWVPVKEV